YFYARSPQPTDAITLSLHDALPIYIRVRQAMNYGVDRQAIIDAMLLGYGKVADAPMPDQVFGHHSGLEPYGYDLDRAKALMAEADRKSTRLNSSHVKISYAVFCLKK